jgi:hypothetical protein
MGWRHVACKDCPRGASARQRAYIFFPFLRGTAWRGHAPSAPLPARVFSSGLPFGGLIFYGGPEFIVDELDNSIKIKGLAACLSLWRAV